MIPWIRDILEKLTVAHMVKKLFGFYGTISVMNVCTRTTTGFYPEANESSQHSRTLLKNHLNIIFPEKLIPDSVRCDKCNVIKFAATALFLKKKYTVSPVTYAELQRTRFENMCSLLY
jgi:hypothetical protein